MDIIGLTGGIASGKSTVAGFLRELGAKIIDTDQVAREIVLPGRPAYRDIVATFGRGVLDPGGRLDRRALGQVVFNDESARKKLNAITHPRIYEEVAGRIETLRREEPECAVVIEAPLLIEAGMHRMVDYIWVVTAPKDIRLKRLMARNNLTREEAESRLNAQAGEKEMLEIATTVIENAGELDKTRAAVLAAWWKLGRGTP